MNERLPVVDDPRSERFRTVLSLGRRSFRRRRGLLRVEGPQAVTELCAWKPETVRDVYFTGHAAQRYGDLWAAARQVTDRRYWLSSKLAEQYLPEAQGVVAVCDQEAIGGALADVLAPAAGQLVVLPRTQDPGNAGTIIRAADSFGAAAVLSCTGSVDLANPKVIRTSAGSIFHVPVVQGLDFGSLVEQLRAAGRVVYGTSGTPAAASLEHIDMTSAHAWVFGNEARGLSLSEEALCDTLVRIPMSGHAESLNVATAASICLFYSQQRGG